MQSVAPSFWARSNHDARALERGEPHAAAAQDHHARPGRDIHRVECGTKSRRHAAADQRCAVEGHVLADLHQRAFRAENLLGERRQVRELEERIPAPRAESRLGSFGPARELRETEIGPPPGAELADAAPGGEATDDVITRNEVGDSLPYDFDDASGFVPEDAGRRDRKTAFDRGEVAVTDSGGRRLHEDLARAGIVDLDFLELEGGVVRSHHG
jgi:hypothetical protein